MKMYYDENADTTIKVMVTCRFCGESHIIKVKYEDFFAWKNGEKLVQNAMPYLTLNERELLTSNTCKACRDKMFADYEDEVWTDEDEDEVWTDEDEDEVWTDEDEDEVWTDEDEDELFELVDNDIDEFIDRFF